jgi:hypothetical protein
MSTSKTVQAAQRLLAEREALGLKKYGTTVDRTDLQAGDWLQHAIEETSDLLLYLIRLQQTMRQGAEFRLHRRAVARDLVPDSAPAPAPAVAPEFIIAPIVCPGTPDAHTLTLKIGVQSFRICGGLDFDTRGDAEWMAGQLRSALESMGQPATKEQTSAAPEDAERAAYLERWKGAPEWAEWLSQDLDGRCDFWEVEPTLFLGAEWVSGNGEPVHLDRQVTENLLGSVRCEPRPTPEGGQGVEW